MLPAKIKAEIVVTLVTMKRLAPVTDMKLALIAPHYVGIVPAPENEMPFHRFSIQTKINTDQGSFVFDTQFLISDDGKRVVVRD